MTDVAVDRQVVMMFSVVQMRRADRRRSGDQRRAPATGGQSDGGGPGGVGMAALLAAKAIGVERVVGVDRVADKLDTALSLGATEAMTPDDVLASGIRCRYAIEVRGTSRVLETLTPQLNPAIRPSRWGFRRRKLRSHCRH
ncbi:zinc-binding dehydrogenase [Nocardia sp. NPDC055049]